MVRPLTTDSLFPISPRSLALFTHSLVRTQPLTGPKSARVHLISYELLTQSPVLSYPNFSQQFLLETDASKEGLRAVLAQKDESGMVHPNAYTSRSLLPQEKNYGISEMEALGVVWAVKHFCHFLYGHKCDVYTDHKALKSLINTPHPSGKLARWGLTLQELDLEIQYQPGKKNSNADALSRAPVDSESCQTSVLLQHCRLIVLLLRIVTFQY